MFPIIEKTVLNPSVVKIKLDAPLIAKKVLPGQFIIFRIDEYGERVPLTVADYDREAGTITLIFGTEIPPFGTARIKETQRKTPRRPLKPAPAAPCSFPIASAKALIVSQVCRFVNFIFQRRCANRAHSGATVRIRALARYRFRAEVSTVIPVSSIR